VLRSPPLDEEDLSSSLSTKRPADVCPVLSDLANSLLSALVSGMMKMTKMTPQHSFLLDGKKNKPNASDPHKSSAQLFG
jgi:hypothetical protein